MTPIKEKTEWMPAMEAAKLLKVHYNTIRQWMKAGRVKYKIGKYKNMTMALVLESSLKQLLMLNARSAGRCFSRADL